MGVCFRQFEVVAFNLGLWQRARKIIYKMLIMKELRVRESVPLSPLRLQVFDFQSFTKRQCQNLGTGF